MATNQTSKNICKYTHRKADKFLVIALHTPEDLLAVMTQLIQFFFNHSCIQGLTFLNELLTLHNYLLNFVVVQGNFLLESLCQKKALALSTKSTRQQPGQLKMQLLKSITERTVWVTNRDCAKYSCHEQEQAIKLNLEFHSLLSQNQ